MNKPSQFLERNIREQLSGEEKRLAIVQVELNNSRSSERNEKNSRLWISERTVNALRELKNRCYQ